MGFFIGETMSEVYPEKNYCIICGKVEVTWPLVCDDCKDHEAQAILANDYGSFDGMTGMECRSCGMIYDGGMRCSYCGDSDPTDSGEDEYGYD